MILCGEECEPCCDFCISRIPNMQKRNGKMVDCGPAGCALHPDAEHQKIATGCGYCEDFHCFHAVEEGE
jgi:hypothetical protein